ncbi:COP9 signalosome complex subunit 1 Short=SGN1; Short=Signalosome subunit 1; AltName: Full=G protein pathway suppressor 1; Short=GPS-1; AltName: Full=JAB1-containing signalosome subunit 1; AltName: Full=Protein MFH [Serendipita indica DSM 11827]|nr:COP9 signalosome complex subunit 1 Short=SGN1; Short=Signalosome subunit 1; AltName: Full=G protein pathway suppressor 1; Short=GPS-1; AltName: Full=JAB1-containing signalosome subunit 1; AltName: Full=Protein MFH [Serendipita indica DSM 11827]
MASNVVADQEDAYMEDSFTGEIPVKGSAQVRRVTNNVVIDEDHPFDLEAYISNYDHDRASIKRLFFIANACPQLAPLALSRAVEYALEGKDSTLYQNVVSTYNNIVGPQHGVQLNQEWLDRTAQRSHAERDKLEVELKMYTGNMIKESIRMGHNELGHFYRAHGDHATALRHYTKSREFCTSSAHVVDMCLNILELLLEEQNYPHVSTYVFKAEAALEASGSASDKKKGTSNPEREKVASPSDIAIFGTLCALATFERRQLKTVLLESETFSYYLEQESYVRDLIEAYLASKFRNVLAILERQSARHSLDNQLGPHIKNLTRLIKNRALVLYFGPFASIRLESLAAAFGLSTEETEKNVVALIQDGSIKGRVDSHNKILKAKDLDHRTELFIRATKTGQEIASLNRKLLYRLRLQEADIIVKPPKNAHLEAMAYGPPM